MKIEKHIFLNNVDKVEKFINDIAIINSRVDLVYEDNIYDAKSILMILSIDLCLISVIECE